MRPSETPTPLEMAELLLASVQKAHIHHSKKGKAYLEKAHEVEIENWTWRLNWGMGYRSGRKEPRQSFEKDQENNREVARAINKLGKLYPKLMDMVEGRLGAVGNQLYGQYLTRERWVPMALRSYNKDHDTIVLAQAHWKNRDRFMQMIRRDEVSGFHVSGSGESGWEGVVAHEFGHVVAHWYQEQYGAAEFTKLMATLPKAYFISQYAIRNEGEHFAEAFEAAYHGRQDVKHLLKLKIRKPPSRYAPQPQRTPRYLED